jgi:hypothetical protein
MWGLATSQSECESSSTAAQSGKTITTLAQLAVQCGSGKYLKYFQLVVISGNSMK